MIAEIDRMLKSDGYRFLKVQPEEAGVYYKYQNGIVRVVLGLLDHDTFAADEAVCASMKEHIRGLFFLSGGRVPGITEETPVYQVDILCLAVTKDVEKYRILCSQMCGIWIMEEGTGRLIIYENQPGDFYGLSGKLQALSTEKEGGRETSQSRQGQKTGQAPWVTIVLVAVNVIVWIVLALMGDTEDAQFLLAHGGMYPFSVLTLHEWYRLFTSMFIHTDFAHLFNNMLMLAFLGEMLEKDIGKVRYPVIYLCSGLGGALASMLHMMRSGEMAVSVGASGAIYGVMGALLWIAIRNYRKVGTVSILRVVIMLALCLYYGFVTAGVDNWCHIGGLLIGFVLSIFLYRGVYRRKQQK